MTEKIFIPPLKIQGIKTKLVPLIKKNIIIDNDTLWVEPFMGSGVVGFNVEPVKAIFADINPFIIDFYNKIKSKEINHRIINSFLIEHGKILSIKGEEYYYQVRERFNSEHNPLDFLFLNRSCFNGMVRFNKEHKFNVPYGHKPERFSKAYITKIINQVKHVEQCLSRYDWSFITQSFSETLTHLPSNKNPENCFVYCDPPYLGRHTDYYNNWNENSELELCEILKKSDLKFMLSTWDHNKYRENKFIKSIWYFCRKITFEHFYFIGADETNRNPMTEALLVNYETEKIKNQILPENKQLYFSYDL